MERRISKLLFLITAGLAFSGFASGNQDSLPEIRFNYFGIRIHYGSMIIHSRAIKDIGNAYPLGLELTLGRHSATQKAWDACNCYPKSGIMLGYWDFNKPDILGQGFSATAFIEPVFGIHGRIPYSIRAGTGFIYLTRPYDPVTNPYNFSYSTRISFPLLLGVSGNFRISPRLNMNLGLIYNHISNGGLREPNKGINWPTVSIGLDLLPENYRFPDREISDWKPNTSNRMNTTIYVFGTSKQLNHEELKKYPVLGAEVRLSARVSRLSRLSLGLEVLYDGSDREEIRRDPLINADHKKAGLMAGHTFLLGRFNFSQALGVYLYNPYKANDPVFQNYELTYRFGKHLSAGVGIKAHRHVADYLGFRIGYSLNF
ncbi:MAG: acyloxyacyl hydrolase [Lentimicrobium sp.]